MSQELHETNSSYRRNYNNEKSARNEDVVIHNYDNAINDDDTPEFKEKNNIESINSRRYVDETSSFSEDSNDGKDKFELKQGLKDRHLSLLALAGIIGPGIMVGAASALAEGPAAILIGFIVMGIIAFTMIQSAAELAVQYPKGNIFISIGSRFVDPAYGGAVGWYYVIIWVCVLANEYNSVSSLLQYWNPNVPLYGFILIFWMGFNFISLLPVEYFGEIEFWLALFKLVGLVAFYIFTIIYCAGGVKGQKAFGFHYWNDPGPFARGFASVASCLTFASTFYSGTEIVAICVGETKNPKKAVPTAIRQTFWRILIVYIGIALSYGITVPYNDERLSADSKSLKSPMSIALARAGWSGGVNLINAFIVVIIVSAANSSIYTASRTIHALARHGMAPRFFKKLNRYQTPYFAVLFANVLGLISLINQGKGAREAYGYIVNLSGVALFVVYASVCFYHIRFRLALRAQNKSKDEIYYKAWLYPFLPIAGIVLNVIVALIQGWSYFKPFVAGWWVDSYILLPFFPILYFFLKIVKRTKWVNLKDVDLEVDKREDVDEYYEPEEAELGEKKFKRYYNWIF
ncbi:AGP3 [Candida pseudojiufengensis]|uniref:AGP3 n=1 Tax=Candida pseudojiufengensis TaxID=497109 RepID=UPI0022247817|nr:AGP3 [Candida pseudojiufengensis]KAI5964657.1 AGP3 [Candida pseudojiufengensis]